MKSVIVCDTHLGLYSDSDIWHDVVYNLFAEIYDYCIRNNIDTITHLGDFFHNRKSTNTKTQHIAHKIAKLLAPLKINIIVGNHDCYFKNKIIPNSLELFKKYNHINIIEETQIIDDVVLVPWLGELKEAKYCMGHFEINGFHMNDYYICKSGINESKFDSYNTVLSGHFHSPSRQNNIIYLGSAIQQTFNDVGGKRGYYVFDDGELTFIEFHKYPHFIKCNASDKVIDNLNGNIVRLTFLEDYGENKNQQIVDEVLSKNPLQIHVDFKISKDISGEKQEEVDVGMLDHDKVITSYIKNCETPKHINKKILTKMMLKFKEESYES